MSLSNLSVGLSAGIRRLHPLIRTALAALPRWAVMGAWFFALTSAIPLIWLMLEGHGEGGQSYVFGASVEGAVHTAWGLTYSGFFGSMLLGLELTALMAAIIVTALPQRRLSRMPMMRERQHLVARMRHIGHGYLTGWAGLWMLGTMYLASVQPGFWSLQAGFITVLFGCTVYRAVREWNDNTPSEHWPHQETATAVSKIEASYKRVAADDSTLMRDDDAQRVVIARPQTDVADVSRLMLQRSAVRPSDRVREIDLGCDGSHVPTRPFEPSHAGATALDRDDYGDSLRRAMHSVARCAHSWLKRVVGFVGGSVARLVGGQPRQPIEIDVAAAENHTDSRRIGRV